MDCKNLNIPVDSVVMYWKKLRSAGNLAGAYVHLIFFQNDMSSHADLGVS